ncbi:MAG: undecaprenyl-diphosphate phosphatase [candidate division WOR-3 bacterium]|nr:undecaprenyl-diphosphate phosphatase [candidate division WOR-3 bacterium]MDW7987372.1 undecaprenyl-diphosphate phosphatase [candidate division WOR-3 bacterium]
MKIIFLGIIQALTEFLPISSSAHLVLMENVLKMSNGAVLSYTAFFHLGTTLATIFYFRRRIWEILKNLFQATPSRNESIHIIISVIVGTVPIAFFGYFFKNQIEYFFETQIYFIGLFLILNGILLFITKFSTDRSSFLTYTNAFVIGLAQVLALLPGISRSGITISTALLLGLSAYRSFEFSFLLSLPAIIGANVLLLKDIMINFSLINFIFSVFIPFFVGLGALKLLNKTVLTKKIYYFAFYSWIFGGIILAVR